MEKLQLNSPVLVSGINDDKPYIEMTTRLCWLDYANLNGVGLSSGAKVSFKTLVGMPVVAKINTNGTKFGSHEVSIDDNKEIRFNTSAYGVHTDVWVDEDEIEIPNKGLMNVPCLFAKARVWKRFSSVVNLIANKLESPDEFNGGLWSSWELQGGEYHFNDNNEKIYDSFTFLSNCLIDVPPAYSTTSKTLAIASTEFETSLCDAYLNDLKYCNIDIDDKGGEDVPKVNETSALTVRDLYEKIWSALNPKGYSSNPIYSVLEIYPEEHKVVAFDIERESSDDYYSATYSVQDENVAISEIIQTKLSKLIAEKLNEDLKDQISELETELDKKSNDLIQASEKIIALETTVNELQPFKLQFEEAEKKRLEIEKAEQRKELVGLALNSGYISEKDLETSEIKAMINKIDIQAIKLLIADRVINQKNKDKKTETAKRNLNDDDIRDHRVIMSTFLGK